MTAQNGLPPNIEDKLDEALALLAAGIPLETVLNEAGADAETLRPLLQIAQDTRTLQPAIPVPSPSASLQAMLAHGQTLSAASAAKSGPLAGLGNIFNRLGQPVMMLSFRTAVLATFIIVAFLFGTVFGGGLTFAAYDSLPGERIYPLKRLGETIRLGLTWNALDREKLIDTYSQRRLLETELLLEQGRETAVSLTGSIKAVDGDKLSLNGLIIQITPSTIINGELVAGAGVQIEAITRPPNILIATTLTVIQAGPPTPVFTPTPTVTATPSPVPTNTPTATPTVEKVQTGDTLSLPPTATSIIEIDDNGDDDGSDNSEIGNEGNESDNSNDNNTNQNEDDNTNEDSANGDSANGDSANEDGASENDDDKDEKDNEVDDDESENENDDDNTNEGDDDDGDDNANENENDSSDDDNDNEEDEDSSDDPDDDDSGSNSNEDEDNSGSGSDSDNSGSDSNDEDNSDKDNSDDRDDDDDKKDDDDDDDD